MKSRFIFLFVFIAFLACTNDNNSLNESVLTVDTVAEASSSSPLSQADAKHTKNHEPTSLKIIKTADLRFATNDLNKSFAAIQSKANQYKAYIQHDNAGTDYHAVYRNLTYRIPSENFNAFITAISKGIEHFDKKEISAQDVTEEFIDVEARLKAKRLLETRYLDLLKKASKVSEMLEIERELATIREEIEAQEGRLKYLQNKVSFSTVSIQMYTEIEQGSGTTISYGTKMWNAVKSGFNGLSGFFLIILNIWPFILILAVVLLFIRKKINKRKAKEYEENS